MALSINKTVVSDNNKKATELFKICRKINQIHGQFHIEIYMYVATMKRTLTDSSCLKLHSYNTEEYIPCRNDFMILKTLCDRELGLLSEAILIIG